MGPRIEPLPQSSWSSYQRAVLVNTSPTDEPATGNWYQTLVRHPRLHAKWVSFGSRLLVSGLIPDRDRELVVLRTAWRTGAEYYWEPHVELGRDAGLSTEHVAGVVEGPTWARWNDHEQALLTSVDELIEHHEITDSTWQVIARTYDDQQLIELPFLVGHYVMVAYVMRSTGVELDEDQGGFELP